jgi:chromosome partitioning protein
MARRAKVYAVMNRKGGVGKTTTAVTLGVGLARRLREEEGGHVLLVDLDPQGNVAPSLGLRVNGATIAELLMGERPADECIMGGGEQRPNLFVLPSNDDLAGVKTELVAREAAAAATAAISSRLGGRRRERQEQNIDQILKERLDIAARAFDYIILDCPPSLDMLANAVYHFADAAIVPVKPDYLGTTGTGQHTANIVEAQAAGIDIRIGWVVPTFFRQREVLANEMLDSLQRMYGKRVTPPIPQAAAVEQAPASGGLTILEYDPSSPAAEAYQQLVEIIHERR